jgi:hypothetical protein
MSNAQLTTPQTPKQHQKIKNTRSNKYHSLYVIQQKLRAIGITIVAIISRIVIVVIISTHPSWAFTSACFARSSSKPDIYPPLVIW